MLPYRNTAHLFHAIMTLLTGGFWLIIWFCCWASNSQHNANIERQARWNTYVQQQQQIEAYQRRRAAYQGDFPNNNW